MKTFRVLPRPRSALASLALAAALLSLPSCATLGGRSDSADGGVSLAESVARLYQLAEAGRWQQAFDAYGAMREQLSLSNRQRLALEYAGLLVDQERYGELQIVREQVGLGPSGEEFRVAMLDAALALEAGEAEDALRSLALKPAPETSVVNLVRFYTLRALTGAALNDLALEFDGRAGVVESLLRGLEELLPAEAQEGQEVQEVQEAQEVQQQFSESEAAALAERQTVVADFWQWLRQLRTGDIRAVLRRLRGKHARGWGRLLLRVHDALLRHRAGDAVIANWSQEYPQHPAHLVMDEVRGLFAGLAKPQRIALLLPLTGELALPARAVMEGFLSSYYLDLKRRSPASRTVVVELYDSEGNVVRGLETYRQLVAEGRTDLVVGPLSKRVLRQLSANYVDSFPLPVLALNYDITLEPGKALAFSLLPEDEVRQVVELAVAEKRRRAVVLAPDNNWGQRLADAFERGFEESNGAVSAIARYSASDTSVAEAVREVFGVNDSRLRRDLFQRITGVKVFFEDWYRQDIDSVFLVANPQRTRLIRPQFKFYSDDRALIYSMSEVADSTIQERDFVDFEGIRFCDSPLLVSRFLASDFAEISEDSLFRLRAFGIDAWRLLPYHRLLANLAIEISGNSGKLSYRGNRVVRRLQCVEFRDGGIHLANPRPRRPITRSAQSL